MVFSQHNQPSKADSMARSFVLWLHGLGDSGPANEPIKTVFTSPEFRNTVWFFPSAPFNPVTCNNGAVMPSWFDIHEMPVTADSARQPAERVQGVIGCCTILQRWLHMDSPKDESSVLKAVQNVHAMIDKEIDAGTDPNNVFVCGLSQGGLPLALALQHSSTTPNTHTPSALTLASVLLYPKTLGGGAVFSGWVPFNSSIIEQIPPNAKRTPVLWCHGTEDRTVLFEAGQAGPPFLEQAGVSCEFKAYPGLGHTITTEELKYLESWIKNRMQSAS